MDLNLSIQDATILYELLKAHLPELRREVARTDEREFRHTMELRQDLCERLLARLVEGGVRPAPNSGDPIIAAPAA
jgi:hypothetical protein